MDKKAMFRKLYITVLLCLFTSNIFHVPSAHSIPDRGDCEKHVAQYWKDKRDFSDRFKNIPAKNVDDRAAMMHTATVIETTEGVIARQCMDAYNLKRECPWCKEEHHAPGGAFEQKLIDQVVNEANTHPYNQRNYALLEGQAVSRQVSYKMGQKFLGQGYTRLYDKKGRFDGWISADKLRRYRPPAFKKNQGVTQSNFMRYAQPYKPGGNAAKIDMANGHLTIK